MVRLAIISFITVALGLQSFGQTRKYAAHQLTEEHGLSQNFAYSLSQDARGFLWIGTGKGLSRYNGDEIASFTTKDSLGADFITADCLTESGNLVLGHYQGGVSLFDGIRFHTLVPDTLKTKVVSIAEDGHHDLWIATQSKGLFRISNTNGTVSEHFPASLNGQIVQTIAVRADRLLIGTQEGLRIFRISNAGLFEEFHDLLPPYTSVTTVLPHYADSSLTWLGTAFHGVLLLHDDSSSGVLRIVKEFQLPALGDVTIQSMAQDAEGDLWIGTRRSGVLYLNIARDGNSVFRVKHFQKSSGFPIVSVNKLIIDRQGHVWAATMGDGVAAIYKEQFTYFAFRERFGVTAVRGITETADGHLVATDVGLIRITQDVQSDEYTAALLEILKHESILSVHADRSGQIWIATEHRGVFALTERNGLEKVPIDPDGADVEVRLFEEDLEGNIWMSARAQGVYELNRDRKIVRHLTTANRFIHNDVFAIKADSKGNIWFGTFGAGLAMLNQNGELQLFSKQEVLRARDINDIDEDEEGNIWIATEGDGFFRYRDGAFTRVGTTETLLSPFIKGIQYDATGRVWFSYRKGLGYYDLELEKKHHFTERDGLLASETYSSAIIVDSKLNKWFCNDYGVTLFEHDTIGDRRRPLETYLTGVRIFFKDIPLELTAHDNLQSSRVGRLPSLTLNHDENHLTFDFVAIKLNRSGDIYYRHRLEGYDTEWTPPETVTFITYTNLDPGKYVLRIQATDDPGTWVDPVTEYSFVIAPPYWKRTWFYLLQIFSVVTLFSLTYFLGMKRVSTKRYVLRLMLFSSFFITLEYVENFLDPLVSDFFDGAPVFRFFLNFVLALLLLPVETLITHWLMRDDKDVPATVPAERHTEKEQIAVEDDTEFR